MLTGPVWTTGLFAIEIITGRIRKVTRKKMCKRKDSRSVKNPTWHLKKMIYHAEQVLRHAQEIMFENSESMENLRKIYLAVNEEHLHELKRVGGKVS